jgi:hypothetical protein
MSLKKASSNIMSRPLSDTNHSRRYDHIRGSCLCQRYRMAVKYHRRYLKSSLASPFLQSHPPLALPLKFMSQVEDNPHPETSSHAVRSAAGSSLAVPTSDIARQRHKIADLESKLQILESGHAVKQRYRHHHSI